MIIRAPDTSFPGASDLYFNFIQAACTIRVPVEVVKQRRQAGFHSSSSHIFREILRTESVAGLYRGYTTTVLREIPFSFIQFPLWEGMKSFWSERQGRPVSPWQSAICGALSGIFFPSNEESFYFFSCLNYVIIL